MHYVRPIILADARLQRGDVVTAGELAKTLVDIVDGAAEAECFEIGIEAIEALIEDGVLKPAKCRHHKLRAFDRCDLCGNAAQMVAVQAQRESTDEVRERIWRVLVAHPDGLTRGELASKSGEPEKTVCWAVADWEAAGLCLPTGATRKTSSGRQAKVITCASRPQSD